MANSILRNAFDRMIASRQRQARRYANGILIGLDDESLKAIGVTREELRREGTSRSGI